MKVPLIVHFGAAAQAVPLAAVVIWRAPLTRPRRAMLAWCGVLIAADLIARILGSRHLNNQWLRYTVTPIESSIVLWALADWQRTALARRTLRVVIPVLLAAWALEVMLWENIRNFGVVVFSANSIILLGASAFTLATRGIGSSEPPWRQDWFWVTAALSLYFTISAVLDPLSLVLLPAHPDLFNKAYSVKSFADIASFIAIARGMLCPISAPLSGASLFPGLLR